MKRLLLLLLVLSVAVYAQATAVQERLALSADDAKTDLTTVERSQSPEVYFLVTLQGISLGDRLSLTGQWSDPHGHVLRTNRWETRPVDHLPWTTHCKCRLAPDDPPGQWHVSMLMNGRVIAQKTFTVH